MKKNKIKLYNFEDLHAKYMKDPEYKRAYEEMEPEFTIIKAIIKARAKHGLTQRQLAENLGISQPSLARFESGKTNPTLSFLQKVTRGLGLRLTIL
jgi:DNA-binding XRE family transcriptional regulator